jgi:RNA polymerase sigma-70 factor (ECF subfamily)
MTVESDAELMRMAVSGDPGAIATLYDRHAATLLAVALRITGRGEDAEDVLHDVFVSLPHRARTYSTERGSALAWMIVLVRNVSIDRVRRVGRTPRPEQTLEAMPPARLSLDPENETMVLSASARVRRALAELPEAQRAALEAAFFEGLTYAQIADRDGVPLNTVKSRCARAMMTLREALADLGPGERPGSEPGAGGSR